jgi:hypothetical protein
MTKSPRIFYLVPAQTRRRLDGETWKNHIKRLLFGMQHQLPSGGVKIIYQHCEMLRRHGIEATPVHLGDFIIDWFPHSIESLTRKEALATIGIDDILLCPEIIPTAAAEFPCQQKIAFVQNWFLADIGTGPERRYEDFGFTGLLACSNYIKDYMASRSELPCTVVTNGIDLSLFKPSGASPIGQQVLYQNRRNVSDARAAIALLAPALRAGCQIVELGNNLSQAEMIRSFQAADIYLAIGYPEGFALPPLEAMACGCVVIGFTGGGGLEHMIDSQSALVAPDGDSVALADCLTRVLQDKALKEGLREQGLLKASEFPLARMEREVLGFAEGLSSGKAHLKDG